jgi:ubiquinone biosynthesis protein
MGPSFIKLGQTLSTRPDMIGDTLSDALSELQDKVPPFSFKHVKKTIEKEFSQSINKLFNDISKEPVAAASIAQVHKALTISGKIVAVKILRPNIERKFARDIKLFYFISSFLLFFLPSLKRYKLNQVVETLEHTINIETDLRLEGASADQLRENCQDDDTVYIPQINWEFTSKRVLSQEWVEGIPISDKKKLIEKGYNLHEIAKNLAITFFNQAYRDGFFHADIHPGNILISPEEKIILVDFGIMGSLEYNDRIFVAKILHGFITRDYKTVSDIHFETGYVPETQSRELFTLACRSIGEPIVGMPVNKISIGKLLKQLFEISKKFDMNIQPKFLLLQKTLVTVEGTGFSLNPDVNMWQLAEPWIKEWANQNFGLKAKMLKMRDTIVKLSQDLPKTVDRMSIVLNKIEKNIGPAGLKINKPAPQKTSLKQQVITITLFLLGILIGMIFKR